MALFYKRITSEITMQYRTLAKARFLSDYVITGTLMPLEGQDIELPPGSEEDEYVLYLDLFDNALGDTIGEQYITYPYPDDIALDALSVIIYNLLSAIPDVIELYGEAENWRNKLIYFNPVFIWNPRTYTGSYQSAHIAGVGAEVVVDFHILSFLAIKVGAEVSQDWVVISEPETAVIDMVLDFPVCVAVVLRPLSNLMIEPYLGGNYNLSLLGVSKPSYFSWSAGVQMGLRAGFGMISFDPRFTMDFTNSYNVKSSYEYWRYSIHLGIGYKFGIIQRSQGTQR
jgi:hypothetical protein